VVYLAARDWLHFAIPLLLKLKGGLMLRFVSSFALVLILAPAMLVADEDTDILARKRGEERRAASLLPQTTTVVYRIDDLAPLFGDDAPRHALTRVLDAMKKNVPSARTGTASIFPSNLSIVVGHTEEGHKDIAAYFQKLRDAKRTLAEAGFSAVDRSR
jgi:hypothetical protein